MRTVGCSVFLIAGLTLAPGDASGQNWYNAPCESHYGPSSYLGDAHIIDAVSHPVITFIITGGYDLLSSGGSQADGYYGSYATVPTEPRRKFTINGNWVINGITFTSVDSTWAWQNARVQLTDCKRADVPDGYIVRSTIPMNAASGTAVLIAAVIWHQLDEEECVPINHSGDCVPPEDGGGGDPPSDQWYLCSYLVSYQDGHEVGRELIGCSPL